jgi:uncharacterized protein with FMN-binding domain
MDTDPDPTFPPPAPIDPVMQARLNRLTANRANTTQPGATSRTTPPNGRRSKRHAAKRSRAGAVLMSVTTAAGLSAYFHHADAVAATATTSTVTGAAVAAASTPATPGASVAASTPAVAGTTATSNLADGAYTGATATNKWGPVQVQITVTGGKITEAVALQTPTADHKSIGINGRATPTLASEVLSAQSADIHTVSGATYTSDSYKISLQSAIDLARSTAVQAGATS